MPEGPFGFPRPFAEQRDQPIHILIEYDMDEIDFDNMIDESDNMVSRLGNEGILVEDHSVGTLSSRRHLVMIKLSVTNIGIQTLEDIRKEARKIKGYENIVISSVPAQKIGRMV